MAESTFAWLIFRSEQVGDDFFSGESGEGERTNELLGGAGHDDLHADAAVLEQADDLRRLVGCNATGDAESDFHSRKSSGNVLNSQPRYRS